MEFVGGGLNLKGDKAKKSKKSKRRKEQQQEEGRTSSPNPTQQLIDPASSALLTIPPIYATKTESELKFLEVQRKRQLAKIEKETVKSHKDRVNEFNTYLSKLSEHNDIPRVGPG